MMAASAEGMIWFWLIVILLIIGRGKILPSERPVVIERTGQYKIDLAPGLNLAQPFIEALAKQIKSNEKNNSNCAEFRFKVRDKNFATGKHPFYLLGVSRKNGLLFFEARHSSPDPAISKLKLFKPDIVDGATVDIDSTIYALAKMWGIELQRED